VSGIAIGLLALWAVLLMVWVVRFPIDQLYAATDKVLGWIMVRVLLRFGVGVFGVLWWEDLRQPPPSAVLAVVVDQGCPEAWQRALAAGQVWLAKGHRVGLVAGGAHRAFWAIPPTVDTFLWHKLTSACLEAALARSERPAYAAARRALDPYRDQLVAVLWIGRWNPGPSSTWFLLWPACGGPPPTGSAQLVTRDTLPLPRIWPVWAAYALLFFVCGGLLVGMEVALYLTGKHLPLRQAA